MDVDGFDAEQITRSGLETLDFIAEIAPVVDGGSPNVTSGQGVFEDVACDYPATIVW